jgi:hypothetical protein
MPPAGDSDDPLGTTRLRAQVLAAWRASPARFREDANAEEELVLGAYRDRLVEELAQNAADAAARAGSAGRLLLRLDRDRLYAANTGAPLDAAGVEALSTLRASAKRDEPSTSGRFGVGFASVRSVADDIAMLSGSGGVGWSLAHLRYELHRVPELADELLRRSGSLPVLRLPFPASGEVPQGYNTVVVLGLVDDAAVALVRFLLAEVGDSLLLALPQLAEIVVEVDGVRRELRADRSADSVVIEERRGGGAAPVRATSWRLATASGRLGADLLADRPVEERSRPWWSLTWAVPVADGRPQPPETAPVVHAPTPTAEPLDLPALLIGSFPVDSTRRLVAKGALRDFLVESAGELYAELVSRLATTPDVLDLVPGAVPGGELDAALRSRILAALRRTPFLPRSAGPVEDRLRPADAVLVQGSDHRLVDRLGEVVPRLVDAAWGRRSQLLARLGAQVHPLADVVDALAELRREPTWWRELYEALCHADRDALGALPVPLLDGRLVRGCRGLLQPVADLPAHLEVLGLRLVHPDAAHPLLERLGARTATPAAMLGDPLVLAAVVGSLDAQDPDAVTDAVLGLVAAAGPGADLPSELGELALRDADGELMPAGELVLPDGPLARLLEPDGIALVAPAAVDRWGADVLERVGVLRGFALVSDTDVVVDPNAADHDLDGEDEWLEELLDALPVGDVPAVLPEFTAVRDLDLVRPDAWPDTLRLLAAPPLRTAVVEPALVLADRVRVRVPSYTAWELRRVAVLGGRPLPALRDPAGDPLLAGLYDDAPAHGLDGPFLAALGLRTTLAALLAEADGPDELLDRLAEGSVPGVEQLRGIYRAVAELDRERVSSPKRIRLLPDTSRVVDAEAVVVLDAPDLAAVAGDRPLLVAPARVGVRLAHVLGLRLASEVVHAPVESRGTSRPVPESVRAVLPSAPTTWIEHDELVVAGRAVDWRVERGVVHAATVDGLARGLAWAAGAWERRWLLAAVLAEPDRARELLAEAALDER